MDLQNLKSAWDHYSLRDANKHQLDEETIREMLKTRTKDLVDKVERNITIGFGVLFLILLFLLAGNLMIASNIPVGFKTPWWLKWLDRANILVLAGSFSYFFVRYYSIRKYYSRISNLREALQRIIKTLVIYKVLFNVALFVLLVIATIEFISGMYDGAAISAYRQGGHATNLYSQQLFWAIIKGIGVLSFMVVLVFLFFRWGFKRLYGNYLVKLKATLKELDEIE